MKTAEGGFDLIVEMLANKNLENDLTMLNAGSGRVMVKKRNIKMLFGNLF